jgi:kynurenine formamidase
MTINHLFSQCRFIDLTHPLDEKAPTWNGSCGFRHEVKMDYDQGLRVLSYKCHAGIGTHLDAPSHFIPGGKNIADIPIETLIVPCCVSDLSSRCSEDLVVQESDIILFEKTYGALPKGCLFFVYTGWSQYWGVSERYRNVDNNGLMHFPTYSSQAAQYLLRKEVVGIGIDTFSPDSQGSQFPVHHAILGAGKYIVENVANLDQMPPIGGYVINLPLNICLGTESPVRIIGIVNK